MYIFYNLLSMTRYLLAREKLSSKFPFTPLALLESLRTGQALAAAQRLYAERGLDAQPFGQFAAQPCIDSLPVVSHCHLWKTHKLLAQLEGARQALSAWDNLLSQTHGYRFLSSHGSPGQHQF